MIRLLREEDASAYVALRREALLAAPLAFASSPEDDFASDPEAVREHFQRTDREVIFGAFRSQLVGTLGLYRDRHRKASHKAHIWGMYVREAHRRQGLGSKLLRAVLAHAEAMPGVSWVHLSVSSVAPEARRLYESAGFRPWGEEPEALRHEGEVASELHMALRLR
jgi:RimJ/RimL family protein N-acetyltransferase